MFDPNLARRFLDLHAPRDKPLLFVTVSGAHLYGFESADSDYDLRGAHIAPPDQVMRLSPPSETFEVMDKASTPEVDLVTHDVRKFFSLLLKNNGYVLEQVFSPLVVYAGPEFEELKELSRGCITRHHRHHFLRFAENQWQLVLKSREPSVKGLLYTYRVLLAGIHLLRTGRVESNLRVLNEQFRLPYIDELIARKTGGAERGTIDGGQLAFHEGEFGRLCVELDAARDASQLPEEPSSRAGLDDLLVRLRMKAVRG
jgi:predicted nucleotidyltransferase